MQRLVAALVIVVIGLLVLSSMQLYFTPDHSGKVTETATITNTIITPFTSTRTVLQPLPTTTTAEVTSTVTTTSFGNLTTTFSVPPSSNDSIYDVLVANITSISNAEGMAINQKTNTIYVENWGSNADNGNYVANNTISVINGTTDQLETTINGVAVSYPFPPPPSVNTATNMIYSGNEIINGSTDHVVAYVNQSLNIDGVDETDGILFAKNISSTLGNYGPVWNTTLYEINATNSAIIKSKILPGIISDELFDPLTDSLYADDCVISGTACFPNNLISINVATLNVTAAIPTGGYVSLNNEIALDQVTNMIYTVTPQNLLQEINATDNQVINQEPISAWTMNFGGISVNSNAYFGSPQIGVPSGEIFVSGTSFCAGEVSGCNTSLLYVFSTLNFGLFTAYTSPVGIGLPEYDPVNNQTYALVGSSLVALKIPRFNVTGVLP